MLDNKPLSDHPFWLAVESGDTQVATALLADEPALVKADFRPLDEQDSHTLGFPLYRAVVKGRIPMIRLLLKHGADVNAKSPLEDQREFGSPIMLAFEQERYDIMHLLLDSGASVDAYGYCYPSMVDLLYEESCKTGCSQTASATGPKQVPRGIEGASADRGRANGSCEAATTSHWAWWTA